MLFCYFTGSKFEIIGIFRSGVLRPLGGIKGEKAI